jgi:oligopeptide/dipeptide ABC transporter ATP-binding protein
MSIFRRHAQKEPASEPSTDQKMDEARNTRSEPTVTKDEVEPPLLLKVRDLSVEFPLENKVVMAVRHASFDVHRGQTLGIVGESGSGKSVTASSIIQLIDSPGRVTNGEVLFEGVDLTRIDDSEGSTPQEYRYDLPKSSIVAQSGASIGSQMIETIQQRQSISSADARKLQSKRCSMWASATRRNPAQYPFQLSGGMNQRVMIALAMLYQPDLLIADEPSSALDVTTQAQVLERLRDITHEHQTSLILITHDIALVAEFADEILVMYAGQVCEVGPVRSVIDDAKHPYTKALLDSVPRAEIETGTRLLAIPGELPDPTALPPGCPFAERCASVMEICREVNPVRVSVGPRHDVACHLWSLQVEEKVG